MNKKFKFASAVLSASLLITPISGLVNNYDNTAKANYNYNNKSKIKKIETYSDMEIFDAFEKAYKNGELPHVTKEQYEKLKAKSYSRGYWGENKTIYFWDGAKDEYISGFAIDVLLTAGSGGVATVASKAPKLLALLNSMKKGYKYAATALISRIVSSNINTSDGIIAYYRPNGKYFVQTLPAGSNYSGKGGYWKTDYKLSHIRKQ